MFENVASGGATHDVRGTPTKMDSPFKQSPNSFIHQIQFKKPIIHRTIRGKFFDIKISQRHLKFNHHLLIIILMEIFIHIPRFKKKRAYNYQNSVVIIYADRVGVRDIWDIQKLRKKWGLRDVLVLTQKPLSLSVEKQAILRDVPVKVVSNPKKESKFFRKSFEKKGIPCFIKSIEDITERNFTMDPM